MDVADKINEWDRILRGSVPDQYKHAKSPVACVQNYISTLERAVFYYAHQIDRPPVDFWEAIEFFEDYEAKVAMNERT